MRLAAFVAYLASWLAVALAAIPRGTQPSSPHRLPPPITIFATILQGASALAITLFLPEGPLRPGTIESALALMLAPLGSALFAWARRSATHDGLITSGPYSYLRHPIYAAFLALLLATGLLASLPIHLAAAAALYVAGTEIRVRQEERDLIARFPAAYPAYQRRTRWRYLPGIR